MAGEQRYGGPGEQRVNVLLPVDYDPSGATSYPVLFLMHPFSGNYTNFVSSGNIQAIVGNRQLVVVMPDGGYGGAYSDWYGRVAGVGGSGPPPAWETYHMRELVPFIDQAFPTLGTREGRAIAGISSGAAGTMKYASSFPDLFVAAASLSGPLDLTYEYPGYPSVDFLALKLLTVPPGSGPPAQCVWGDPYTQRVIWEDHNPTYLASNLHGVDLWLSNGEGVNADGTEWYTWHATRSFIRALERAGVPHTAHFRPGGHNWSAWRSDLELLIPWMMDRFEAPAPAPARFSLRSAARALGAWGWTFETTKEVREFTYVDDVRVEGFTITGSGRVDVETAPLYVAGEPYSIAGLVEALTAWAGEDGRLRFSVDLGPSHATQQYYFGPVATPGAFVSDFRSDIPPQSFVGPEMGDIWETRTITIERGD